MPSEYGGMIDRMEMINLKEILTEDLSSDIDTEFIFLEMVHIILDIYYTNPDQNFLSILFSSAKWRQ